MGFLVIKEISLNTLVKKKTATAVKPYPGIFNEIFPLYIKSFQQLLQLLFKRRASKVFGNNFSIGAY